MSSNGISHLEFKADRQRRKLEEASIKRAATGRRSAYDINELPTVYADGDNDTNHIIKNPHPSGLVPGRPWLSVAPGLTVDWYGTTSFYVPTGTYTNLGNGAVILSPDSYVDVGQPLRSTSFTITIDADLGKGWDLSRWDVIWGNDAYYGDGSGHTGLLAYFDYTQIKFGVPNGELPLSEFDGVIGLNAIVYTGRRLYTFVINDTDQRLYIDGILIYGGTGGSPTLTNNNFYIGSRHANDGTDGPTDCHGGTYYSVKVEATVKNDAQVLSDYQTWYAAHPQEPMVFLDANNTNSYNGSGGTWYDLSGSYNDFVLENSPTFGGSNSHYLSFDGNTQFAHRTTLGDLPYWSVETWVRVTDDLGSKAATSVITTVYDEDYGAGTPALVNFNIGTGGGTYSNQLCVSFFADSVWQSCTPFTPNTNSWYHIVGTYNGTDLIQYVNGVQDNTFNSGLTSAANGGSVRIARRWDQNISDTSNYFPGDIGLVRVYNFVLSESNILSNYNATKSNYPQVFGNTSYTVRQFLFSYNSNNGNGDLYVLDTDYPDVATIPVGAQAVINGNTATLTNNSSITSSYFNDGPGYILQFTTSVGSISAGTYVTFYWTV